MCCRRTAARAPPRLRAVTSRSSTRSMRSCAKACCARARCTARSPPCRSASGPASRARSRLRRGLGRRDRHERRDEQRRRVRRSAGHGRRSRVSPARARRAAQPRGERHRPAIRAAAGSAARGTSAAGRARMRVVLATGNPGKLAGAAGDARAARDRGRAALAIHARRRCRDRTALSSRTPSSRRATPRELAQLPAIADDSGLEVDALHGAPGIYSARYAGEHASDDDNLRKLLEELDGPACGRALPHAIAARSCTCAGSTIRFR